DLAGELAELVAQHPLSERLRAQLMLALYRDGRQAEALEAYRAAGQMLSTELGLDPTPELRRLHRAILNGDASLAWRPSRRAAPGAAASPAPAQLPAPAGALAGRERELAALQRLLAGGDAPVVVVHGPGGVGKSSLAVAAARLVAPRFPDGQLYVDL